ncbi:MAG: cytochrome C oxidase Cbb3 [Bacteroidota bacterium]
MLSEHFSKIEGVGIFPVISLIVFFLFFVVTIVWVFRLDKKYLSRMENLPLESSLENNPTGVSSHNNSEMKDEVNQ